MVLRSTLHVKSGTDVLMPLQWCPKTATFHLFFYYYSLFPSRAFANAMTGRTAKEELAVFLRAVTLLR